MLRSVNAHGLGKFRGTIAELIESPAIPSSLHEFQSSKGLDRPDQHEPFPFPLYEKVQHPVHSVVQIDIGCACPID